MNVPTLLKKSPQETLSIIDQNLLLIGSIGVGKTVALKTFAYNLVKDDKRVLFVDQLGEGKKFAETIDGESVNLINALRRSFPKNYTNLLLPSERDLLTCKVVLDTLETFVENRLFDYILLDESQLYLKEELSDSLIKLLQKASNNNIKIFLSLQTLAKSPISKKEKNDLLEYAPQVLMFDGIDAKLQAKGNFQFAIGESLLFHIKQVHPLVFVPFELDFEDTLTSLKH